MARRNKTKIDIYGGGKPGEVPLYFVSEAASYLGIPSSTIRSWVLGSKGNTDSLVDSAFPFIVPADPANGRLSFLNLSELHVLNSLRRQHRIQPKAIKRSIAYLRKKFGSEHPLIDHQMMTDGKDLFIERYNELVNVARDGQLHMKKALEIYLKRIAWDSRGIPIRLYPFTRPNVESSPELIVINPLVRSGKPCLDGTGIPTRIIAERHRAGDSIATLRRDYERPTKEIEEAIRYESGTAA